MAPAKDGLRYSHGGVYGSVAGRALGDAGPVINDVLVAVSRLALLTLEVEVLAELQGDTAPALESVVAQRAVLHARALVQEVAAGHAATGSGWLQAAAQALLMAAPIVHGAGAVFAGCRTNCQKERIGSATFVCLFNCLLEHSTNCSTVHPHIRSLAHSRIRSLAKSHICSFAVCTIVY